MVAILFGFIMVMDKIKAILFWFPMVLDRMVAILFKTEHPWKMEHHWNTKQRATIGIQSLFGIPAPIVRLRLRKKNKSAFFSRIFIINLNLSCFNFQTLNSTKNNDADILLIIFWNYKLDWTNNFLWIIKSNWKLLSSIHTQPSM